MEEPVHRGLHDVFADTTAICEIRDVPGLSETTCSYRGFALEELAERCSFEDVACLLLNGGFPTPEERAEFDRRERSSRGLPLDLSRLIAALRLPERGIDLLRMAVAALAIDASHEDHERSPQENVRCCIDLLARLPGVLAWYCARREGRELVAPRGEFSIADNLLAACGKEPASFSGVRRCFEVSLILYSEHGFNAATFAVRTVASTLSDLYSAVLAGMAALKGPRQGGANERSARQLLEIGRPERVSEWIDTMVANGQEIYGFGHRVEGHADSRAAIMRSYLPAVVEPCKAEQLYTVHRELERQMKERFGTSPNLDYSVGLLYWAIGLPIESFTAIFAIARMVGWTAHFNEQLVENVLIRPRSQYVGPESLTWSRPI